MIIIIMMMITINDHYVRANIRFLIVYFGFARLALGKPSYK